MRFLFITFLGFHLVGQGQLIDHLKSHREVLSLLDKIDGGRYHFTPKGKGRYSKEQRDRMRQFSAPDFAKADFDGNGYTDLLFNGYFENQKMTLVVMAYGKDSFNIHHIPLHSVQYYGAHIEDSEGIPQLRGLCIGYHYNSVRKDFDFIEHYDSLDFKYGSFIERSRPVNYAIRKISFLCWGGLGMQNFSFRIDSDSLIKLEEIISDSIDVIEYKLPMTAEIHASLYGLLNHLHFPELKEQYGDEYLCAAEATTIIEYEDGTQKRVADRGMCGTQGLRGLYDLLWNLRKKGPWVKSLNKPESVSPF